MSEHVSLNNSVFIQRPSGFANVSLIVLWRSYTPHCVSLLTARGCPCLTAGLRTFSDHACVQTNQTLFIRSGHSHWAQRGFVTGPALDVLSVSWEAQE